MQWRGKIIGALAVLLVGAASASAQGGPEESPDSSCNLPTFWVYGGYQGFVINRGPLNVPLVTTDSSPNINTDFGALGQSGTTVLYGPSELERNGLNGYIIRAGVNFSQDWALEGNYFFSEQVCTNFNFNSDASGNPVLARPVFLVNTTTPGESAFISSFPGEATGQIRITTQSRLLGTEELISYNAFSCPFLRLDLQPPGCGGLPRTCSWAFR
jgi:hypothetical protein